MPNLLELISREFRDNQCFSDAQFVVLGLRMERMVVDVRGVPMRMIAHWLVLQFQELLRSFCMSGKPWKVSKKLLKILKRTFCFQLACDRIGLRWNDNKSNSLSNRLNDDEDCAVIAQRN